MKGFILILILSLLLGGCQKAVEPSATEAPPTSESEGYYSKIGDVNILENPTIDFRDPEAIFETADVVIRAQVLETLDGTIEYSESEGGILPYPMTPVPIELREILKGEIAKDLKLVLMEGGSISLEDAMRIGIGFFEKNPEQTWSESELKNERMEFIFEGLVKLHPGEYVLAFLTQEDRPPV